ncbi:vitamin K-dependent gamma-carboxylase-like [Diadema antillarum]|uniref:vitamin K-dependent gamma-carboxylase-like n=1 Tax=Diadema antillarum TaxID=105358 RepID=UPI003A86F998
MPTRKRVAKSAKGKPENAEPTNLTAPSAAGDAPAMKYSSSVTPPKGEEGGGSMKRLMGFDCNDLQSWSTAVRLLNSPRDPSATAAWRILFGLLMMMDIIQERGMAYADHRWGDTNECRFPLFNSLAPLPVDWMYVVYLTMITGALGIFLGAYYRLSCLLFLVPYWYIFFLDKTAWNNHSYLYGLIGLQLVFMDGNRFWSVDGWLNEKVRNRHVPLWNIGIIRFQIFIVYFFAGLKKLDADWVGGYSMEFLSRHWVFEPFRLLLTDSQIDYFMVHLGGLALDLSAGFLLFFDATRPAGTFFTGSFHIMNSQLFSIGMFPFAMLASTTVFYSDTWPRKLCRALPSFLRNQIPSLEQSAEPSEHCIYSGRDTTKKQDASSKKAKSPALKTRHHLVVVGCLLYASVQLFLPYSHFITKGYNNWTNGLYGYSWDMMVHTWETQHIKMKYVDGKTGEEGYLAPEYWVESNRWASHSDMTKQYATCIANHLESMGVAQPQLYVDVWKSMNSRFRQRMFDPNVDLVRAHWSPFSATPWLMPLLIELSDWRTKLAEIEDQLDEELDVVFLADFPGLFLENYISEDLGNTSIQVLSGKIMVELVERKRNITMGIGDRIQLPAGAFHNVHTISDAPSCYMYVFVNTTEMALMEEVTAFFDAHKERLEDISQRFTENVSFDELLFKDVNMSNRVKLRVVEQLTANMKKEQKRSMSLLEKAKQIVDKKWRMFHRVFTKTAQALNHVILGGESVVQLVDVYPEDIYPEDDHAPPAAADQEARTEL